MGTEYYLVNHDNQTMFELGKGGFSDFDLESFLDHDHYLVNVWDFIPDDWKTEEENAENVKYFEDLWPRFQAFIGDSKNIKILNDSRNEDEIHVIYVCKYRIVDSIYKNETKETLAKSNFWLRGGWPYDRLSKDYRLLAIKMGIKQEIIDSIPDE